MRRSQPYRYLLDSLSSLLHTDSFGLHNVVQTCITPGVVVGAVCKHPKRYLFWDGIHPTSQGHRVIANAVEALFDDEETDEDSD